MKILVIKTSSLGDVVHALPAVTEAAAHLSQARFHWVVEENFADIPRLHPRVEHVIPLALRRWRKGWVAAEVRRFIADLRRVDYDMVIDSQGLLKSALVSLLAQGPGHGFNKASAREKLAPLFYRASYPIPADHAIQRQKKLFAACLGYESDQRVSYGLPPAEPQEQKILLLHGTTWKSKEWPESAWQRLAEEASAAGYELLVPAGDEHELERAGRILGRHRGEVLYRLPLARLLGEIRLCAGVVSVDTGLGHLASALGVPMVGIFGATDPHLTGMVGDLSEVIVSNHLPCIPCKKGDCKYIPKEDSSSIYPPCYERTTPETVWRALRQQIRNRSTSRG